MSPRMFGGLVALAVFVADQAAKIAVLSSMDPSAQAPARLVPFLDLVLRWNRGVSFSLLVQDSEAGRVALLGFTVAAVALFAWWLATCRTILAAASLGAIIGGALGNACDRLVHGAVVDYLDLHVFGHHLFVFNLADAAINIGVLLLLIDVVFGPRSLQGRTRST
jgi:signal peptidase II